MTKLQAAEVATLESILYRSKGWLKASQIVRRWGDMRVNESSKRFIRRIAAMSSKIISGDEGYKHVSRATVPECSCAAGRLLNMSSSINRRISILGNHINTKRGF